MSAGLLWGAVVVAAVLSFVQKWLGYQVPESVLQRPWVAHVTSLLPVALLGALVATQTFTSGPAIVLDSRLAGLVAAGLLLWRRAPFLVVVLVGALVTAGLRLLGLP